MSQLIVTQNEVVQQNLFFSSLPPPQTPPPKFSDPSSPWAPHQRQKAWASWVHAALSHWLSRISKQKYVHHYFSPTLLHFPKNTLPLTKNRAHNECVLSTKFLFPKLLDHDFWPALMGGAEFWRHSQLKHCLETANTRFFLSGTNRYLVVQWFYFRFYHIHL